MQLSKKKYRKCFFYPLLKFSLRFRYVNKFNFISNQKLFFKLKQTFSFIRTHKRNKSDRKRRSWITGYILKNNIDLISKNVFGQK